MYSLYIFALLVCAVNSAIVKRQVDSSVFFPGANNNDAVMRGGMPFPMGVHNYFALLSSGAQLKTIWCAGSVVSSKTVLTSAHCIDAVFENGALDSSLRVRVGTNRFADGGSTYSIGQNVTHPEYSSTTLLNNIGVLVTSSAMAIGYDISPIKLNYAFQNQGVRLRMPGWGIPSYSTQVEELLTELYTTTANVDTCVGNIAASGRQFSVSPPPFRADLEMCIINEPNKGLCNGNYGSSVTRQDVYQQIGIVSWGFPCSNGSPTVFVRLSPYEQWLKNVIVN